MDNKTLEFIKNLQKELKTQDNQYTKDPIFVVVHTYKKFISDDEFDGNDGYTWVSQIDHYEVEDQSSVERLDAYHDEYEWSRPSSAEPVDEEEAEWLNEHKKFYYINVNENLETFLTYKAASEYIDNRQSSYDGRLFISCESAYRNPELRQLRQYILDLNLV